MGGLSSGATQGWPDHEADMYSALLADGGGRGEGGFGVLFILSLLPPPFSPPRTQAASIHFFTKLHGEVFKTRKHGTPGFIYRDRMNSFILTVPLSHGL